MLASASPARLATLRAAGITPEVLVSGVDESAITAPGPAELTAALAELKATAVALRLEAPALVLGCDSLLEFDGAALGKPADAAEARTRWRRMRGRSGVLHTGHYLIDTATDRRVAEVGATEVHFAQVSDDEIEAYVASGEPLHVAGAFTIDGRGAPFVSRITGDHGTVVGLSMPLLRRLLAALGIAITELW